MRGIFIEKYRARILDEVYGNDEVVAEIKSLVKNRNIPHILLSGLPGIGKTTIALATCRELFGENYKSNTLELNASDESGIATMRGIVKTFAKSQSILSSFKIVILDEADALTQDSMYALRRIMEDFSDTCRFILTCNYESKIIDAIKSRCTRYKLKSLKKEDLQKLIDKVAKSEGLEVETAVSEKIVEEANGDARFVLNKLQTLSVNTRKITLDTLRSDTSDKLHLNLIQDILFERFLEARNVLRKMLEEYNEREILTKLETFLIRDEKIPVKVKGEWLLEIAKTDYWLTQGTSKELQLEAMIYNMIKILKEQKTARVIK